jgi:hypothetical protein
MASTSSPIPARGPHPPQDESKTSAGAPQPTLREEEITVEAERGPHPPQDEA